MKQLKKEFAVSSAEDVLKKIQNRQDIIYIENAKKHVDGIYANYPT